MTDLLFSIGAFIFIYLCYLIFVIARKQKMKKFKNNSYVTLLVKKYNVDLEKTNIYVLANVIALVNSFIVSITLFIVSTVASNVILMLISAFLIIVPLQLIMYYIVGHLFGSKK